jgi:multimeric flavodoxin WrbA
MELKVVAIVGSPRSQGSNNYLVDIVLKEIALSGIETKKFDLSQYRVSPCQGHDDCASYVTCQQQDDAPGIINEYRNADGVILSSPVYFGNVSAQMKAFMDRTFFCFTHNIPFKARGAGFISIGHGGGADETIRIMKRFVRLADDRVLELSGYAEDVSEIKSRPELINSAKKMGQKLAEMLKAKK